MRKGNVGWWIVAMVVFLWVAGILCMKVSYSNGFKAGYEAGSRDARNSFAELACKLPGTVDASCASLPNIPLCDYEDGTPEGCLRRDSDGTWYWVVNMDGVS